MYKFASQAVDFHDSFSLLSDLEDPPDFVKKADFVESSDIPMEKFALVLVTPDRVFTKFALNNKAMVWVSSRLFQKTAHLLPSKGRQVAAHHIQRACAEYRISCPGEVKYAAAKSDKVASNVLDMSEYKDETSLDYDKYRVGWRGEIPKDLLKSKLEEFATRTQDDNVSPQEQGENLASRVYSYAMNEGYSLPSVESLASAANSALPKGAKNSEVRGFFTERIQTMEDGEKVKRASVEVQRLNYAEDTFGVTIKTASGETLGRFPMNTEYLVKQAQDYFWDNFDAIAPEYRHQLAQGIVKNGSALGMPIDDTRVLKYAGVGYSRGLEGNVLARIGELRGDAVREGTNTLKVMVKMASSMSPEKFAEVLSEFDKRAGIDTCWDKSIKDPWLSTFEHMPKMAMWTYRSGDDTINEEQLRKFMLSHSDSLSGYVDQHIVSELKMHPVEIFDSLPMPVKDVVLFKMQEAGIAG